MVLTENESAKHAKNRVRMVFFRWIGLSEGDANQAQRSCSLMTRKIGGWFSQKTSPLNTPKTA